MKICPRCRHDNDDAAENCHECGAELGIWKKSDLISFSDQKSKGTSSKRNFSFEESENKDSTNGSKGPGFFILATIGAVPFILVLAFMGVAKIAGKEVVMVCAMFLPLIFVATVFEIIFVPLALIKGHNDYKPCLLLYIIAIFIYWITLLSKGPW
jgi:hypothetical protein